MFKLIQKIHIVKSKLGLTDEEYRVFLYSNFKTNSSKNLTQKQLQEACLLLEKQLPDNVSYAQLNLIATLSTGKVFNILSFCSKIIHRKLKDLKIEGIQVKAWQVEQCIYLRML